MRAKAFRDDTEHWFIVQRLAAALVAMRRIDAKLLARLIDSARKEYQPSGMLVKPAPVAAMAANRDFSSFVRDLLPDLHA
jgi:hypothetical protein